MTAPDVCAILAETIHRALGHGEGSCYPCGTVALASIAALEAAGLVICAWVDFQDAEFAEGAYVPLSARPEE